jgi:hypothetical protein
MELHVFFFMSLTFFFLQFQLVCSGCPSSPGRPGDSPWICDHCYYKHPDPIDDPFYQSTVKSLMYFCAVILLLVKFFFLCQKYKKKFRRSYFFPYYSVLSHWSLVLIAYPCESDMAESSTTFPSDGVADSSKFSVQ